MTHLVIVTTSFPDSYFQEGQEAAGAFVFDFVVECANRVEVTVVAPSKKAQIETAGNLTIHRFPVPSLPLSLLHPANPISWPKIFKTLRSGETAVRQAVQSKPTDHIFALWALPSGYWARKIGGEFNVPFSTWALGSDIWGLGKVPFIRSVLREVLRGSQYRFADGFQLAEDVTRICDMQCDFLPSSRKLPVTAPEFQAVPKILAEHPPYKLAFLGRWHPNKGIDILLESLSLLNDEEWEKIEEVRIYGGGPMESEVKKNCEALRRNGRAVTLGGYLNRQEATELLLWADYLLLPSRIESIPVIFSDAMQTECPIISTPIGDLPRLIHEFGCGILARQTNAVEFRNSIVETLKYSPRSFQKNLELTRERFNLKATVENLLRQL